jgi:predicted metal-binding membrane protein
VRKTSGQPAAGIAAAARPSGVAGSTARPTGALAATLGVASTRWVTSVRLMTGMDTRVATGLGSLAFFTAAWMAMMVAMMLPARPRRWHEPPAPVVCAALSAGSYLAVWALAGAAVSAAYRPYGTAAAGAVTIAAGTYELTLLKRHFRRCRQTVGSGFGFGLCRLGASAGLMAMLVVLGAMSAGWMAVIAVLVTAQKLLHQGRPRRAARARDRRARAS